MSESDLSPPQQAIRLPTSIIAARADVSVLAAARA
jgi:hypothetical protein